MQPAPSILVTRIIWAAMLMSQGIYVGMIALSVLPPPMHPPQPIMLTALSAVAMVVGAVSVILPRFLASQAARQLAHGAAELASQGRDALLSHALRIGFAPYIVSLALSEAVAIFGLVLGAIGFDRWQCAPFFAAGAMLTLIRFPTEGRFLQPVEDAIGRRGM